MVYDAEEERNYLLQRSQYHRHRAAETSDAGQCALHLRFAELYQARAESVSVVKEDAIVLEAEREPGKLI
ncbi:hypothetical protein [Sphingomonas morindae]|uniref:Uncharacterized protein n=1 Tax=Sphingomonas morindae TaxID=1541170 RepID=A0ABY4X6M7_9SPHN|nr:hypothetical protein [Sphingomonas morindae]USI72577.1 hypothetical protein LHA26_15010 [Sphingomonas morindae]